MRGIARRIAGILAATLAAASATEAGEAMTPPTAPPATTIDAAAISPEAINRDPTADELAADEGPGVLRAQVLLDRAHFSSGVLNGKASDNTANAVRFFQEENGLPATGRLDEATYAKLVEQVGRIDGAVEYTLTDEDARGPYFWVPVSVYDQEKLPCECYASALEMLDERFHTVADVLRKLNPSVSFAHLTAGTKIWVPNVE